MLELEVAVVVVVVVVVVVGGDEAVGCRGRVETGGDGEWAMGWRASRAESDG